MAHNTRVPADTQAPPVTAHPGAFRLRPCVARLERRRRARGAPHLLQLAGLRDRRGAPRGRGRRAGGRRDARARRPGERAGARGTRRHGERRARQRHHVAHLRLRRHAPEDHHPSGRAGRIGRAGIGGAARRVRSRRDRCAGAGHRRVMPDRQHHLPRSLRPRLAHHRVDRHAGRGGRLRPAAGAGRAPDRHGPGHRRVAAGRPARTVRHDDQTLSSGRRGPGGPHVGPARAARIHGQPARAGGATRLRAGGVGQARLERGDRRTRRAVRDLLQHLQAVCLRHRDSPEHRRLRAVARAGRHARAGAGHRAARALPGAGTDGQARSRATACRASSASTTAAPPG